MKALPKEVGRSRLSRAAGQYRRTRRSLRCPHPGGEPKAVERAVERAVDRTLSTAVECRVEGGEIPANRGNCPARSGPEILIENAVWTLLCSPLPGGRRGTARGAVADQIELTAERLWADV